MAERLVVCGGLPAAATGKEDVLELDATASEGAASRVNLKLGDLSVRMVEDLPHVLTDLIEVAAYVYCADQFTRRGGETMSDMGRDWFRRFRFRIPVRRIDLWQRADIRETLIETLASLSDDHFDFDFVPHPEPQPTGLQPYLDFGDSVESGFIPDDVILFSGGLDSFAGAVESLVGRGRQVALVSHRASPMIISKQSGLVAALRERTKPKQLFHVPVSINKGHEEAVEFTQRTRSFLFATLGLVIARLFRKNTVQFYENGVVSVNLPVAGHVLGTRATRTTHPKTLADFSRLFSLILDEPITVENPYFWRTKAEVVGVVAEHGCADLIADTFSCTRVREATQRKRHCGACSQCLDRRFGILGAKLGEYEPSDAYVVDLFRGERKPGPDVVMAESYVLHALKLSSMSEQAFFSTFGQIFRILPHLPGTPEENARKLYELHRRHGQIVQEVVSQELRHHATLVQSLSLPDTSLLMLMQSASVRLPELLDQTETEAPASEQAARDSRPTVARPLVFAIDEERKRVLFRGSIEVKGAGFEIVRELAREFEEDINAGRPKEEFRFVLADTLSKRLKIDGQGLRQRITRLRRDLERKFLEALDVQLDTNDVIENDPWRGYRLNPYLLRVHPAQIRDGSV
ncbi:7-cyano-7-deazaguanine synthase [Elioraea sp.]|uniref:7-cyano-7-deazaguanine synthase n=1 Tax=Elioraea sp. TaxID=2185103 RepID=UPI00307E06CB